MQSRIEGCFECIYGSNAMSCKKSGKPLADLFHANPEMILIGLQRPVQVVRDLQDVNCKAFVCMLRLGLVIPCYPLPVIVEIRCGLRYRSFNSSNRFF